MRRQIAMARRTMWLTLFAAAGGLQTAAMYGPLIDVLYLPKWGASLACVGALVVLGRGQVYVRFGHLFALAAVTMAIGVLAQLPDGLDTRALQLAVAYGLTAGTALLISPAALSRHWVRRAVWLGLLAGTTAGLIAGFALGGVNPGKSVSIGERLRYFGLFAHPNIAGNVCLTVVILSLAAAWEWRRVGPLLATAVALAGLALCDARGATVGVAIFLVGVVAVGAWQRAGRIRPLVSAVAFLAALAAVAYGFEHIADVQPVDLNRVTSSRLDVWQRSLTYLVSPSDWLLGQGMSRNLSFVGLAVSQPVDSRVLTRSLRGKGTDNSYLDLLLRTGLLGLAAHAAWLSALVLGLARRCARYPAPGSTTAVLGLCAAAATAAWAFTDSTPFSFGVPVASVVWPLAASSLARAD